MAQDALIRAHRSFRRIRHRDRLHAWLVKTAWRLALDYRRGERRRLVRQFEHHVLETPDVDHTAEARERAAALWEAIDALPEKLRLTIVLSGIAGHDVGEVARLLDLPAGTVKSRLFHARRQLQERLQWIR